MLIKVKDLTVLEIVSKSRRLNKGKHPHITHKQTHFRSRINAYARTKTPKYNYSIRSPSLTLHLQGKSLRLLATGNTKTAPSNKQLTVPKVFSLFQLNNVISSKPTFLTRPSASTSGCENFSLKVFTPANLEESRATAAILKGI